MQYCYGHKYARAIDYLESLASNEFWQNATPALLPWHEAAALPVAIGAPRYIMHESVLNALAPSVPLRAIFGGDRNL